MAKQHTTLNWKNTFSWKQGSKSKYTNTDYWLVEASQFAETQWPLHGHPFNLCFMARFYIRWGSLSRASVLKVCRNFTTIDLCIKLWFFVWIFMSIKFLFHVNAECWIYYIEKSGEFRELTLIILRIFWWNINRQMSLWNVFLS